MAWIESHQSLSNHPKTRKLARILDVPKVQVIGHLHCLWWWAMDYAEDGSLQRYDELDIAIGAEWEGDPATFIDALVTAGFLESDSNGLRIHDWDDYAGKLIDRRKANAERMRNARAAHDTNTNTPRAAHVQRTQRARVERPNRTQPNQTEPLGDTPKPPAGDAPAPPQEPAEAKPKQRSPKQQAADRRFERYTALFAAWCRGIGLDPESDEALSGRDIVFRQLKGVVDQPAPTPEEFERCTRYLTRQTWRDEVPKVPTVLGSFSGWVAKGRPDIPEAPARASPQRNGYRGKDIGLSNDELMAIARGERP